MAANLAFQPGGRQDTGQWVITLCVGARLAREWGDAVLQLFRAIVLRGQASLQPDCDHLKYITQKQISISIR